MIADLFNASDLPFNLAGESQSNELTEEGAKRAKAEAEANQRKAQLTFDVVSPCEVCGGILSHRDEICRYKGRRVTVEH